MGNGEFKAKFKISKRLRQSCPLSPTLLKIFLQQILTKWRGWYQPTGITVADGKLFTFYADGQLVVGKDAEDLSYVVSKLNITMKLLE